MRLCRPSYLLRRRVYDLGLYLWNMAGTPATHIDGAFNWTNGITAGTPVVLKMSSM